MATSYAILAQAVELEHQGYITDSGIVMVDGCFMVDGAFGQMVDGAMFNFKF